MSHLFRKPESIDTPDENIFSSLGLTRNPFPANPSISEGSPDDRENGDIFEPTLRKTELATFKKLLIPSKENPDTKSIAFLMDYATRRGRGIGKTAFLKFQQHQIMKDLGFEISNGTQVLFAVYLAPNPKESSRKFYSISRSIIEALIDQDILIKAMCRIRVFLGEIPEEILELAGDNLGDTIGDDLWLHDKFREYSNKISDDIEREKALNRLDTFSLQQKVQSRLAKIGVEPNLAHYLSRFGHQRNSILLDYLFNQKEVYWKENADDILFDQLVKVFREAAFSKGIILFDELEKIVGQQNPQERRSFCDNLRYHLIDGPRLESSRTKFFSTLLTIHPYLQELLDPHWSASGLDRFASLTGDHHTEFTVYFKPLDESGAVPLALAYLRKSQISPKNEELTPFTKEALHTALKLTLGVPGKFLTFLHLVVAKSAEKKLNIITEFEVEGFNSTSLDELPFSSELDNKLAEPKRKLGE